MNENAQLLLCFTTYLILYYKSFVRDFCALLKICIKRSIVRMIVIFLGQSDTV
jgi:hypothetical protein